MFDEKVLHEIRSQLIAKQETIAVAESVTAGLLQFALAQAKDASCFFQGGITAYNIGQKCRHLCVEPIHAEACNCVSAKVCAQMAVAVAGSFSSDWGISVTGYATRTDDIERPFAFYHIARHGEAIASGKIESAKDEGFETQKYFTACLLEKLVAVL